MVRSSNWKTIFNDIEKTLERTVIQDIEWINKYVRKGTPYKSGNARNKWRIGAKYKLGVNMDIITNTAKYIAILDYGSTPRPEQVSGSFQGVSAHSGPSSPKATSGIVRPILNRVLLKNRKI
tara:strand:- start:268 stop:633 length:366 start_codon:yes stop_codon:yes gene_type:complete